MLISSKYGNELPHQKYVATQRPGDWYTKKQVEYAKNFVEGAKRAVFNNPDTKHLPKWLLRHTRSYRFRQNWQAQRDQDLADIEAADKAQHEYDRQHYRKQAGKARKNKFKRLMDEYKAEAAAERAEIGPYSVGPQKDYHVKQRRIFTNKQAALQKQRDRGILVPQDVIDLT